MTMKPVDPDSSAAKIAAQHAYQEPPMDPRFFRNDTDRRRAELIAALEPYRIHDGVLGRGLDRVIATSPEGPADQVAAQIVAEHPHFFGPDAPSSVNTLITQFHSGTTAHVRGGIH